jgi:hypothetical protein
MAPIFIFQLLFIMQTSEILSKKMGAIATLMKAICDNHKILQRQKLNQRHVNGRKIPGLFSTYHARGCP